MSSRRAFLASLGAVFGGLALPGMAFAWARRRRLFMRTPIGYAPSATAAAPRQALRGCQPVAGDCICCQSVQQIGSYYYYTAVDCTQHGCAFSFSSQTLYPIYTGCPNGKCSLTWPPE
ncbi:MAG TPA: hypothetical protein VFA18_24005 [Gemmataceae bacterium]|nr:hypothetical protein [Gemmataceae bacterium]